MFVRTLVTILTVSAVSAAPSVPDALRSETLRPFDRYVQLTEARIRGEIAGAAPLMWVDRQPSTEREKVLARLGKGEIVSVRLETKDGAKDIDAPGGLIHHWVGTVFLPGVTPSRVRETLQNYDRYAEWFSPLIQRAHITAHTGDSFNVAMRTEMHKILTVTADADYVISYQSISPSAFHVRSVATNIHIVDSAGSAGERRTPTEQTFGFLWRLNTYCSFSGTASGTYEQCESVSLTRNIPFGLGPIVRPLVSGIPRETLEFTLGQVRKLLAS